MNTQLRYYDSIMKELEERGWEVIEYLEDKVILQNGLRKYVHHKRPTPNGEQLNKMEEKLKWTTNQN